MTRPQERQKILTQTRNLKMARSAHAYVCGSTVKFYEWLDSSRRCQFPDGPPVWICGDCHVGNLGPLADAKGRVLIQIRDLDQTVIGNPAHDLIRLGLSLASASRGSDLPGVTTARILEELVAGYQSALSGSFETDRDKSYRPKSNRNLRPRDSMDYRLGAGAGEGGNANLFHRTTSRAANLRTRDPAFVTPRRRGVNARAPAARHRLPARSA